MESSLVFLTVVLSIFLAIFLLLGIIFLVRAIQIANRFKEITDTTHKILGKIDNIADVLKKTSGSFAIGKAVTKIVDHLSSNKQDKSHKDKED